MMKVKELEQKVEELSSEELADFRKWFAEFDAKVWDIQIEQDIRTGKLDKLAQQALQQHAEGKTIRL